MSSKDENDLDRVHALMMAALDDECTAAERQELDAILSERLELKTEWDRLRRLKEVTATMGLRQPPEEVWDRYRASVLHRAERSVAWTLIVLGGAVAIGWVLWQNLGNWIADWIAADLPIAVKVGVTAVGLGAFLLIASIARERWVLHRHDPYSREVIR